jgi:predicted PurR-regulated permease PerM
MTSLGFWLVGLPFWLLIGMIAGLLNIIPFVGPWVGGALGVLVGLTETDVETAIWAAIVAIVVQQIDNHFISPNVLGATVRLHPATIILALLAGGTIAGIFGVLLAVPVVAVIKILIGHYWRTRVLGESWEQASEALIEEHPTGETLITRLRRISPPDSEAPADEGGGEPPPST